MHGVNWSRMLLMAMQPTQHTSEIKQTLTNDKLIKLEHNVRC